MPDRPAPTIPTSRCSGIALPARRGLPSLRTSCAHFDRGRGVSFAGQRQGSDEPREEPDFMQCPLCGGPLHVDEAERFVCERGHEPEPGELEVAATQRATHALWMAIAALESEAAALRTLAGLRKD